MKRVSSFKLAGRGCISPADIDSMNTSLEHVEADIRACRLKLDSWLAEAYADTPELKYYGEMDASYPCWEEIETVVGCVFDRRLTSRLSAEGRQSLLFFISRSDEIGSIIAWLNTTTGTPFSSIGDLAYEDFVFLCHQTLAFDDDCCDYQLVACFQKLACLGLDDASLLKEFFERKSDLYTRRMAVHAFAKFRHHDTAPLVQKLWMSDNCEFTKLSCLYSLMPFPEAKPLFAEYLAEYEQLFPASEADYRQTHFKQFRQAYP